MPDIKYHHVRATKTYKEMEAAKDKQIEGLKKLLNVTLPRCDCGDLEHCVACKFRADYPGGKTDGV